MSAAPPFPRKNIRTVDNYRSRTEFADTPAFWRVGYALAQSSLPRLEDWMLAKAVLHDAKHCIRSDGFYDQSAKLRVLAAEDAARCPLPVPEFIHVNFRTLGAAHAAFEHEGCNIYEVGNGLAEKLAHTELHGLMASDVRLPFRSIYLIVPPGSGLRLVDGRPVAGVYLTECIPSLPEPLPGSRMLIADIHGEVGPDEGPGRAFDGAACLRAVMPCDDTLEKCVAYRFHTTSAEDQANPAAQDFTRNVVPQLWRWLLNVVLYLTMPGARVEHREANRDRAALQDRIAKLPPGEKRERLKFRLKGEPSDHRIYLGAGIKYEGRDPSIPGGRAQPDYVVRVPGHWKMQPHGPCGALRKRIHIEPYWRNLDAALAPASATRVTARSSPPVDVAQFAPALAP